jgi:hypothetical protein
VVIWVATAPTLPRTQTQRPVTAMLEVAIPMPSMPVRAQRPTIENVIAHITLSLRPAARFTKASAGLKSKFV